MENNLHPIFQEILKPFTGNKKEMKDYLKYYIGCQIKLNGGAIQRVSGMEYNNSNRGVWLYYDEGRERSHWLPSFDFKLILRRVENITEDEQKECANILNQGNGFHLELLNKDGSYGGTLPTNFEVYHYLLSRQFDLFGLIESGCAIELQNPERSVATGLNSSNEDD